MTCKEMKLIIIKTTKDEEKVSDFFDSFFNVKGIHYESIVIYKLVDDIIYNDFHLTEIVDSLKDDFGHEISLLETNIIEQDNKYVDEFLKLINQSNFKGYNNMCSLVFNTKDESNLNLISKIALKVIDNDDSLYFVIQSMFKNNLNVSKSATDVYMHRNTVINKLDIITKKTGLNIQHFNDAMAMYILLNNK